MTLWSIEPRDTLVLRDGRPMRGGGLQMTSLPVPYPSAIAGVLRTRSASDEDGRFLHPGDRERCEALLATDVRGPWLGLHEDDGLSQLLPAPRDAVWFDGPRLVRLGRAAAKPLGSGESTDLPDGLEPVFLSERASGKHAGGPAYWRWDRMADWLRRPDALCGRAPQRSFGLSLLDPEVRTSVAIDRERHTASDGQLFSVEHRRYVLAPEGGGLAGVRRLSLLASCDAETLREGTIAFAGERRLVSLRSVDASVPDPPDGLLDRIVADRRARAILLTPAVFDAGWRPAWLLSGDSDVRVTLRAAVTPRPEVVSGWDFARNAPKPTRRLVPAGAVYFLAFEGAEDAVRRWLAARWWRAVSDDPQARRDGFGLCVFGADVPLGEEAR